MDIEVPGANLRRTPSVNRRTIVVALVVALLGVVLAAFGILSRQQAVANLQQIAAVRAMPTVEVAAPAPRSRGVAIELPGRLEAYARAPLFARVSGYVARWHADIGTKVKAGEILAEIEAPDLDQQLFQAQSDLANAQANEQLANVTNQRYQALLPNATVSRQAADEKAADLAAKRALVRSQEANVARLQALTQYKRVVAPFDGVVTARSTDVGALINAGSAAGSELFVVSDTNRLRLYVSIPQSFLRGIEPGIAARLIVPERPDKSYAARVEAGSGAIDPATGTMRTQLVVENPNGELIPGSFATVHFHVTAEPGYFTVPASAVIFDKGGLRVAIVAADGTVALRKITIARDLGNTVEVSSGLGADDRVVQSPPDDLRDGDHVAVKESVARDTRPNTR
jgi:multidrug efflux system membrane fusion protein